MDYIHDLYPYENYYRSADIRSFSIGCHQGPMPPFSGEKTKQQWNKHPVGLSLMLRNIEPVVVVVCFEQPFSGRGESSRIMQIWPSQKKKSDDWQPFSRPPSWLSVIWQGLSLSLSTFP